MTKLQGLAEVFGAEIDRLINQRPVDDGFLLGVQITLTRLITDACENGHLTDDERIALGNQVKYLL